MKTIKLIDLFIKMANGEDTPEKIKFDGKIFTHNGTGLNNNYYCGETDEILEECFVFADLNDEIEIIEDIPKEDKKIEIIGNDYYHKTQDEQNQIFQRKINEIIDMINGDLNERDN